MDHNQVNEMIRETFVMSEKRVNTDNLPVLVRRGTRNTLAQVFAKCDFNRGVEIGCLVGRFAKVLCEANPKLHLTTIDPWVACGHLSQRSQNRRYNEAVENLKGFNVTILKKFSMEALQDFADGSIDFVFIDGAHDYDNACADLIFWSYKVRENGIIALHDYMAGHGAGVMKAVDGYTHCHDIRPWYVTREHQATAFWVNHHKEGMLPYKRWVSPDGKRLF
jgi:predicted O-methyltransferase YrrM